MRYKLIGKHFSVIFFTGFLFVFREVTHAKNVNFPRGFLCSSFVEGETKEAFCFYNVFCIRYILKTKRKPAKKKIHRNVFVSICSSYDKNKKQPKIRYRLVMPLALQICFHSTTLSKYKVPKVVTVITFGFSSFSLSLLSGEGGVTTSRFTKTCTARASRWHKLVFRDA